MTTLLNSLSVVFKFRFTPIPADLRVGLHSSPMLTAHQIDIGLPAIAIITELRSLLIVELVIWRSLNSN